MITARLGCFCCQGGKSVCVLGDVVRLSHAKPVLAISIVEVVVSSVLAISLQHIRCYSY